MPAEPAESALESSAGERERSVALDELGDVLGDVLAAGGRLDEALSRFEESLALRE